MTCFRTRLTKSTLAAGIAAFGLILGVGAGSLPQAIAAELTDSACAAIPKNVQQLIVVDYHAMQDSPAAMQLKAKILPPQIKQLEDALNTSGLDDNRDVEELAFAAFKTQYGNAIVGLAQGQFPTYNILADFKKHRIKPKMLRHNSIYPMGRSGMEVVFLNPSTMLFGSNEAVKQALDARDGFAPSFLDNSTMMNQMRSVQSEPMWSILDQQGTQDMMRSILGSASQMTDYNSLKDRLLSSRYTMSFDNGVKFNLGVVTTGTVTAATMASLLNAAALYKKMSGTAAERQAIDDTTINSSGGLLNVSFSSSDSQFTSLLNSDLFETVVK